MHTVCLLEAMGYIVVSWTVHQHPDVRDWLRLFAGTDASARVEAALDMLAERGPGLGRPVVDTITNSRHADMKELRVGSIRILFAFDPQRDAVLLVGGDKRGEWKRWYDKAVPLADDRFDEWLADLEL